MAWRVLEASLIWQFTGPPGGCSPGDKSPQLGEVSGRRQVVAPNIVEAYHLVCKILADVYPDPPGRQIIF